MKSLKSITIISLFSLFIISCKKNDNNPSTTLSNKIKTYSEDYFHLGTHNVDTFNLSYNSNGLLELMQSRVNPGNKIQYTFSANNTFTQDFYVNNKLDIHSLFFLVNNVADSFWQVNSGDTTTTKFLYNSVGQLIKMKEYDYKRSTGSILFNTTNFLYDASGNVTKDFDTYGNVNEYTYYLDQPDLIEFILPFYKYSTNLVKTQKLTNNVTVENLIHTYTFDNQKRVISDKEVVDNGDYVIKGYTYY